MNSPQRNVLRIRKLEDEGKPDPYIASLTSEQRVLMVWPITVTAWKFKDPNGIQPRLSRHVVRIERG